MNSVNFKEFKELKEFKKIRDYIIQENSENSIEFTRIKRQLKRFGKYLREFKLNSKEFKQI